METKELTRQENGVEKTPNELITLAIQQGMDVEKLGKLMELQERWQATQARKSFLISMSQFQSEVPVIEKKKKVSFGNTKYSYAELGEIALTIKDTLKICGLSYRWEMNEVEGNITCDCIVSHIDGHSERTHFSSGKDTSGSKNDIQARGSSITYLQRYSLIAALGLTTANEDTDGRKDEAPINKVPQAPINKVPQAPTNPPPPQKKPATISMETEKEIAELKSLNQLEIYYKKKTDGKDLTKIPKAFTDALAKKKHELTTAIKSEHTTNAPAVVSDGVRQAVKRCETLQALDSYHAAVNHLWSNNEYLDLVNERKMQITKTKTTKL